jgi:YbbR domain-containing protein
MNAMEICNFGCVIAGYLDYAPQVYDDMLAHGKRIYCIATDDNHNRFPADHPRTGSFGGFTVIKAEKLDYETITVAGPASILNQIDHAQIYVNIDGRTSTLDDVFAYTLCDRGGKAVQVNNVELVTAQPGEVKLLLPIQQVKKVKLALNVIYGGGVTEKNSQILIEPASILVSGSEESLADLGDTLIIGEVDLSKLNIEMNQTFDIILPAGVTNRTMVGMEHKANVTISFPDLKTATYTITNIVPINVPGGLGVDLVTKQFSITLRGPKALIDALDASQIVATVDAAEAGIGELHSAKPVVKLPAGFEAVGMISAENVQIMFKLVQDSGR